MLDILLFREDKGGNPELIRESQRRRNAPVETVDEVIALDKLRVSSMLPVPVWVVGVTQTDCMAPKSLVAPFFPPIRPLV